jgi:hypothetical protein
MKTLISHGRKDEIVIHTSINNFASEYFKIFKKKLTESYIFNYKVDGNCIEFNGTVFRFAWNGWNLFNTISYGKIEFTSEDDRPFISHQIKFTEAFVIAIIFNLIPLFTLKYDPDWSLYIFIVIWIFYAVVYFVSVFRFNSYVTEVLIEVNKISGNEEFMSQEGLG